MAEDKQYITQMQENGSVMISEDVVATIVASTLAEIEGVSSLGSKPGISIADFAIKKNWSKSLKIVIEEDNSLSIDCTVMMAYNHSVVSLSKEIQTAIMSNVESATGAKVTCVNVNVCGIVRE